MQALTDPEVVPRDLVDHLARTSRLSPAEARRLALEVLAYFSEAPEAFVTRRHAELRARGENNAAIFTTLRSELTQRRFAAPAFSERQVRRIIYG